MTGEIIRASLQTSIYQLKEGTKTSYYRQSGSHILPNRLSISRDETTCPIVEQMIGAYDPQNNSPIRQYKLFCMHTQTWEAREYPIIMGYGIFEPSNNAGKREKAKYLLAFITPDN